MNFKLKPLVASMALIASGAALAAGFTPPESATAVDRLDKALERNHNGRFGEPNDWFRRITLSGEMNIDALMSSRTQSSTSRFGRHRSSDINLSDANIYANARVNDWVTANVDLVYDDNGPYENINSDHIRTNGGFFVDEAYATVANFRESPVYFLAGREYVPFGHYVRHPITASFTQLLTQTNATAAQVGFIHDSGFNGAAFVFRNKTPRNNTYAVRRVENGGLQIGYRMDQGDMGFNLDASMLANMADVDYIANGLAMYGTRSVKGYNLVAQGHYMGFDGEVQYVRAGDDFAGTGVAALNGDKPRAWLVGAGYSFDSMGHTSRIGLNYQRSREADGVGTAGLPKRRWQADYSVNVYKNTDVGFEWVSDKDYSTSTGRTGRRSGTGLVRLSTRFA